MISKTGYPIIFSNYFTWRSTRHILFWVCRILMCFIIGIPFVHSVQFSELYSLSKLFSKYIHDIVLYDIPFTYVIAYILIPTYLLKEKYNQFILFVFMLFICSLSIYICIEYRIQATIRFKNNEFLTSLDIVFILRKIKIFLTYTAVSSILFTTIKLCKSGYLKEQENQNLIVLNANAKMEILRSRIHPHFLFNTLNTIYSFTLFDHSKTSGMLSKLYNILHYMIYDCNTPQISFNKEINALLDYINLERERYGEKLSLHIKQSGSFQNKKITPLLLQPFVENAFKHGASKMIYHPWIDISISIQDHLLHFTISNSISENNSISDTSGIGLDNIRKRLAILYPDQHVFEINRTEQVYTAKLIIPLAEDPSST